MELGQVNVLGNLYVIIHIILTPKKDTVVPCHNWEGRVSEKLI